MVNECGVINVYALNKVDGNMDVRITESLDCSRWMEVGGSLNIYEFNIKSLDNLEIVNSQIVMMNCNYKNLPKVASFKSELKVNKTSNRK